MKVGCKAAPSKRDRGKGHGNAFEEGRERVAWTYQSKVVLSLEVKRFKNILNLHLHRSIQS